jgi:predicted nucleic acid-binding protein
LRIFIDTNIPVYASGSEHPLKAVSGDILALALEAPQAFVTDAEVLQEMLHRYMAIQRLALGIEVIEGFAYVMDERIEPVKGDDVQVAASLASALPRLSARDLMHLAVMRRLGVTKVVSSDRGFDGIPDIERLDPARLSEWRSIVIDEAP